MFYHAKELQFNARVSAPDPRFAGLLLEQFGGGNGELKAAMQYFVQAFSARRPYPEKYDLLMDIAMEEFSHLEIVGATITMLLDGINGELKDAASSNPVTHLNGKGAKENLIQQAMSHPGFLTLSGGGPLLTNSQGVPWSGSFVDANGDLTVDLRSDIAAESRAKIVYEYLIQFTDDSYVQETLRFLMTREVAHFQMFAAALDTIQPNFPPGVLQGDPRYTHRYFNLSSGGEARGPWNEGQGPWESGEQWDYIDEPHRYVVGTFGETELKSGGGAKSKAHIEQQNKRLSKQRSDEVKRATGSREGNQWSSYPQSGVQPPDGIEQTRT